MTTIIVDCCLLILLNFVNLLFLMYKSTQFHISNLAQRKRVGLITQRSLDRHQELLSTFCKMVLLWTKLLSIIPLLFLFYVFVVDATTYPNVCEPKNVKYGGTVRLPVATAVVVSLVLSFAQFRVSSWTGIGRNKFLGISQ